MDSAPATARQLETRVVKATCPHDCPDACSMRVTVDVRTERAIRRAKAHHRPWHAALATEKAARCYLALDLEQAGHRLIEQAHAVCPYSNAVRGNVEVALELR